MRVIDPLLEFGDRCHQWNLVVDFDQPVQGVNRRNVVRTLLSHFGDTTAAERRRAAAQRLATLTDREREVAVAIGSGASNAEVAASLFMSEATVKAHVSRLFTKLDVANRVQIAIVVHDAGLV